jgi:PhnB protein
MRPPVAPYLTVSPAMAAIAFYTAVFGARQKAIMPALDGLRIMHCELEINGGSVMLAELATASVSLEYAESKTVDGIFAKATGLGARVETSPTDSFWGTRVATFRDPFGHRWILNAPLA